MKIVKFKNGQYGVRKWCICYWYRDIAHDFWWTNNSKHHHCCQGTREEAQYRFDLMQTPWLSKLISYFTKDKGTPIGKDDK